MKYILSLSIVAVLFFSSCIAFTTGNVSSGPLLNIKDRYADVATGEAKAVAILGFGSFDRDALIQTAKKEMMSKRPLGDNEYYANINVSVNNKYVLGFLVMIRKVVVSCDIMSQNPPPPPNPKTDAPKITHASPTAPASKSQFFVIEPDTFRIGDMVYGNIGFKETEYYRLEVIGVDGKRATFRYMDANNPFVTLKTAYYRFFSTTTSLKGFKFKDKVALNSVMSSKRLDAVVLGVTSKYVLLLTEEGVDYYPPSRVEMVK